MTFLEQAIQLSNEGVVSLSEGDNVRAVEVLAESIKLFKSEMVTRSSKQDLDKSAYSNAGGDFKTVEVPDMDSEEHCVAFNQAIHLPCELEDNDANVQMCSATVIFNLAIAHHHQFLGTDKSKKDKAIKLYSMVLKLLEDVDQRNKTAMVVKLATINNLAHIRFTSGDYESARSDMDQLSGFMRHVNQTVLEEPEVQGLLMNVLMVRTPRVAPAA
eukprot:Nitzschia sp. Nitz4//scaffold103_size77763//56274//56918//NITZ4_005448-RA/size77763-processed-gene-0.11-mRNA-1//1//CDS//3329532337//6656//frame0